MRYSPAVCTAFKIKPLTGNPGPAKISTSYIQRQDLTMRMAMRRFTRLTNGFSKKVDNHMAAIALHSLPYNFARPHKTLADPTPGPPPWPQGRPARVPAECSSRHVRPVRQASWLGFRAVLPLAFIR